MTEQFNQEIMNKFMDPQAQGARNMSAVGDIRRMKSMTQSKRNIHT
jgi:hypothetical protein